MNRSEPMHSQSENADEKPFEAGGHVDRVTGELQRARARQRKIYAVIFLGLLLAGGLVFSGILFSNATIVEVSPDEARDHADIHVVDGFAATIGNAVYSLHGMVTVEATAPGFRPARQTLAAGEAGGHIRLMLTELPGTLHLRTQPGTDNTRWFIDGSLRFEGAVLAADVKAGEHRVEVDSPYDQRQAFTVSLQRGELLERTLELKPVAGQLNIKSMPAGATVRIEGKVAGVSPISLSRDGGRYHINVSRGGYQSINEDIEITNVQTVIDRDYRLKLVNATVHVNVSPAGGRLLVDGKQVSSAEALSITARESHMLLYTKPGYASQRRDIRLQPGEESKLTMRLQPEMGKVRRASRPNGDVLIDDPDAVDTPLKLTNAAGIRMLQFRPNETFMMGAPRSETGQRANEFLRSVKLTRPFYISMYEVSRSQYKRFKPAAGAGNEPVTSVSWIEAAEYCNWLSNREQLQPFYQMTHGRLVGYDSDADGYRLPSEAEWEWLARKAGKPVQTRFTWGDDTTIPAGAGNIADESANGTVADYVARYTDGFVAVAPVGSFKAEPSGLYDMSGNVSEWVHDVYTLVPPFSSVTQLDPLGAGRGDTHTVKGSNWRSGTLSELRAAYREGEKTGREDIGFRVVRYILGGGHGSK